MLLASLQEAPVNVVGRGYMGRLADRDSRQLKPVTVLLTPEEISAATRVVQSPRTVYESNADFWRHAVYELLQAYSDQGLQDSYVTDIVSHIRGMREAAETIRMRQDFGETVAVYETSLNHAIEAGDLQFMRHTLAQIRGYLDRTPERYWRGYMFRVVLKSTVVVRAVEVLYEGSKSADDAWKDLPSWEDELEEQRKEAEMWQIMIEGLGGV